MRKLLSLIFGKRRSPRNPRRFFAPLCESLEQRLAPAASLYVTTADADPWFVGSTATFKEFTPTGTLVRSVPVVPPWHAGEPAHDLIVTPGKVHVYTGNEDATLYTYNGMAPPGTSPWSGIGQGGLSTRGDIVSSGGAAVIGNNMFLTDMDTPGGPQHGILWISLDNAEMRFAEDTDPIDVAAGLDGLLYSLDSSGTVRVYDPDPYANFPPFTLLRTVQLPAQVQGATGGPVTMDYRAIAVDQNGSIYAADWNAYVTRFAANGTAQITGRLPTAIGQGQGPPVANLVDIDFLSAPAPNDGGQLVVGSTNGVVARVSSQFLFTSQLFSVGTGPAFVAVGPALVEASASGPGSVQEGTGGTTAVDFTVSLSNPSTEEVVLNWRTTGGSATSNSDFQSATGTLTFTPGETTKSVSVQVIGDTADEFDESFSLQLTAAAGAVIPNAIASVTILDDDAPATVVAAFSSSAGNALDSQGDGTFESFSATTGTLRPDHNTASREQRTVIEFNTAGIDVGASPVVTLDMYIEFPWFQSTTAKIYGYAGDGIANLADATRTATQIGTLTGLTTATAWRRITLDHSVIESFMGQSQFVGVLVVADMPTFFDIRGRNDSKGPRLNFWSSTPPVLPIINISGGSSQEGTPGTPARSITFTVQLSQATTAPVTVDYATREQPGVQAGVDFVATSGTLTFSPGQTSKTVAVPIISDSIFEPNDNFLLDLSDPRIASFNTLSAFGTILNDDAAPIATVRTAMSPVTEPAAGSTATVSFNVSLSNASSQQVTVSYSTAFDTASAGDDYIAAAGTLIFAPGETLKNVNVTVVGDGLDELDETFKFNLTSTQNASIGNPGTSTVTILDSDPTPTIRQGNTSAAENAGQIVFVVSLSGPSSRPITVDFATANGTATAGADYTARTGTLTFAPGETGLVVPVALLDDNMYEGAGESVRLNLSNPTNATIGAGFESAFGTIADNDPSPTPAISSPSVSESEGSLTFAVTLSNPSAFPINLNYSTQDGTATTAEDYMAASGTLAFAAGETSKTVTVAVLNDGADEANETLQLRIPYAGTTWQGTGTIVDDDPSPTLTVSSPSIAEGISGTTLLTFMLSLSNPSSQAIAASYATADGTATAGSDFTAAASSVTFAPGETSKTVVIEVNGDTTYEPTETLSLIATMNGTNTSGTGTIVNDDALPTVSANSASVPERNAGQATLIFTIVLSNPSSSTITVNYGIADGTASVTDADVVATNGTLTFLPGETNKTVSVQVNGDAKYEADETFTLALSSAVGASLGSNGTGTILNDDAVPSAQIASNSIFEGHSGTRTLFFFVTLSNPSYQTITIGYSTGNGSAAAGSDYQVTTGSVTFSPGQTSRNFSVPVIGDRVAELNETFLVNLGSPSNATIASGQATGTIVDDEPRVSIGDASVQEGRKSQNPLITFTVTLSAAYDQPVTMSYQTVDNTAKAGEDYVAQTGTLTFAAGETSKTITIQIKGDNKIESAETFFVDLLGMSANARFTKSRGIGTVLNDD